MSLEDVSPSAAMASQRKHLLLGYGAVRGWELEGRGGGVGIRGLEIEVV